MMDLELSISLADPLANNNFITPNERNYSPTSMYSQFNGIQQINITEPSLQEESNTVFSIPIHESMRCLGEEEEDVNSNELQSKTKNTSNSDVQTTGNLEDGKNQLGVNSKLTTDDTYSNDTLLKNYKETTNWGSVSSETSEAVHQQSLSSSTSSDSGSRNGSFRGPLITSIKIGTPVRKNSCTNQANSAALPSEVEYTISITDQNTLKLQMTTSPSVQSTPCSSNCSCTNSPEKKRIGSTSTVDSASEFQSTGHKILVEGQTVRLRPKKNTNRNNYNSARSHLSKTDEMKRHSAEISQLRHALEQKIATCQSSLDKKCDDSPQMRRPSSALGCTNMCNSPSKEYVRPSDPRVSVRKSASYTSSPVHWRNHVRNTVHVADPRKLKFLLEDHQKSCDQYAANLYNEYKNVIGSMDDRISSPNNSYKNYSRDRNNSNYNPYIDLRCSSPFSDTEENSDSLYSTPLGSPGPSSFLRSPRTKNETRAPDMSGGPVTEADGRTNYYPNCDATIWLRSCQQEIIEPLSGVKTGEVPMWLSGTLIRNGPGRLQVGEHQYNHLFDGSALLHRFHFKKGQVTYQNRFLKSRSYLRDTKAQRIVVNYFGTRAHPDPCRTILQNIASKFDFEEHFTDNAQISLYPYGDGLYALTETPFIFRVDPETLDTHEKVDLTKCVAVLTHTAHPHIDRDGSVYNIGQGVGPVGPRYHICKFPNPKADKKGKTKTPFDQAHIVGSVNARWRLNPCYMHSFAMTENYFIIIEQPLVVSVPKILRVVLRQDALIDALQWWEKETKIHVVRRDNGYPVSTQYVTETFFFLHTINAYEDKGHIILDIATYKNAEMLHCMYVEALKNAAYDPTYAQMFRGRPKRWVIPLRPNKDASVGTNLVTLPDTKCQGRWLKKNVIYLTPELLADIGCEVPRIHYDKFNGLPYRYFYAICSDVDHPSPGTLVKVDVVNKTHVEWSEDNVYPSEPIFVPHPDAENEDDGVVLCALLRAKGLDNQICLLILDAATFTEKGRVEFVAPGPVPKCLHGWFVHEGTLRGNKENAKGEEEEKA